MSNLSNRKDLGPPKEEKPGILEERPTEVVSGLAIAAAVYGFCAENGVPNAVAAVIAIICGFGPLIVSNTVDRIRSGQ